MRTIKHHIHTRDVPSVCSNMQQHYQLGQRSELAPLIFPWLLIFLTNAPEDVNNAYGRLH